MAGKERLFAHPTRTRSRAAGGANQLGYGFFPATGTDYTQGDEPTLAARLGRLARSLHLHLVGISGYRTPEHSVAVGGFANDPHTRGQASDTPGIEGVAERVLNRFGLTRPFSGAQEADHIQLLSGSRPAAGATTSGNGPAEWLKAGGWPAGLIPTMVAIGGAESGWKVDATNTNTNGTTDDGWLQVNSVHGYDRQRLRSDPIYAAAAAYAIYKQQGFAAWVTYNTGAFRKFLGQTPRVRSFTGGTTPGKTRPGGEIPGEPDGPDVTQVLSDWADAQNGDSDGSDGNQFVSFNPLQVLPGVGPLTLIPGFPNPLHLQKALSGSIHDAKDFFKLLAWIINPVNILRMVEFLSGLVIMAFGFHSILRNNGTTDAISQSGLGRVSRELSGAALTAAAPESRVVKAVMGGKGRRKSKKDS